MNGHETSDPAIVAVKPANADGRPGAEAVEPRAGAEGNAARQRTLRAQDRASVTQGLDRVRQVAREKKKERFTTLLHHISPALLRLSFFALKREAAPGVDGMTWRDYAEELELRLAALHERVHSGAYRPEPSRRRYIPKPDGRQRPPAVAALEDKILQRATATVLNAIYEEDFLGFSYGFRPRRGQHDALVVGVERRTVNWILDANDPASACPRAGQRPDPWAEAICEAVSRPSMRFVAIKTEVQQAAAGIHKSLPLARTRLMGEGWEGVAQSKATNNGRLRSPADPDNALDPGASSARGSWDENARNTDGEHAYR